MMTHDQMVELIARDVCGKPSNLLTNECHQSIGRNRPLCNEHEACRIFEKSEEQLSYILSSIQQNHFLRACPGCGKTEVVGLKAAYEIQKWLNKPGGMAVLTFTNNASEVIRRRISQFSGIEKARHPHFIGTIDSWLHSFIAHPFGHLLTGYQGKNGDHSIRVIDNSSKEGFLFSYQTKYSYHQMKIFANQFYYDLDNNRIVFDSNDQALDASRNSMVQGKWQIDDLNNTKLRFFVGGFATYQDIEWLCYRLLKERPEAANKLSQRFPLIIVDECQDLSWIQLQILEKLKAAGTVLHFVGDLQQSIYEFKHVDPQKVNDFAIDQGLQDLFLTSNFRSCQQIVTVCQKIVEGGSIVGACQQRIEQACICKPYKKEELSNLIKWFESYLTDQSIDIGKSTVLARSWKSVSRLRPSGNNEIDSYQKRLAMAINLWKNCDIQAVNDSLRYLGLFLVNKYFTKFSSNSRQFYCPESVASALRWRIFLSKVLDACIENEASISDLDQTWDSWVAEVRSEFGAIVRSCSAVLDDVLVDKGIPFQDLNGKNFKVPNGLGTTQVIKTLAADQVQPSSIRVTTIHSVKGQTFDAVLLVSARQKSGTSDGYWTQWLADAASEAARLAYVASSRSRYLLAWALPEPTDEEKLQVRELGFYIVE
jgi:DNA helicase II / ATP-dependent DNA helicase PcrA